MEPSDDSLDACVAQLSALLAHEDTSTAQKALKCFASLADKFTRKGEDPAPLAKWGLAEELIKLLNASSSLNTSMDSSGVGGADVATAQTAIGLLSALW